MAAAVPAALGLSRSRLQTLIAAGAVSRPTGEILRDPRMRIWPEEEVLIELEPPAPPTAEGEDIPLDIVFEDAHLIVVNKPAGLVVHPAPGAETGTLVNALLHHCGESLSGVGGVMRPGIVHRIDKDTSGLLVVAKSDLAHHGLSAQFKAHDVERRYLAACYGEPTPSDPRLAGLPGVSWEPGAVLCISGNIARHAGDRKRMAVVRGSGRHAVTRVKVLEVFDRAPKVALVECRLETGRTHQIRVHMSHVGHPLVGDKFYRRSGNQSAAPALERQALHAASLGFIHPTTGELLQFEAPLPEDFMKMLELLRRNDGSQPYNGS